MGSFLLSKEESKAFEANGLCPGNVSFPTVKSLPARDESSSPPLSRNDDCNADSRAGVREGTNVAGLSGSGYRPADQRSKKD